MADMVPAARGNMRVFPYAGDEMSSLQYWESLLDRSASSLPHAQTQSQQSQQQQQQQSQQHQQQPLRPVMQPEAAAFTHGQSLDANLETASLRAELQAAKRELARSQHALQARTRNAQSASIPARDDGAINAVTAPGTGVTAGAGGGRQSGSRFATAKVAPSSLPSAAQPLSRSPPCPCCVRLIFAAARAVQRRVREYVDADAIAAAAELRDPLRAPGREPPTADAPSITAHSDLDLHLDLETQFRHHLVARGASTSLHAAAVFCALGSLWGLALAMRCAPCHTAPRVALGGAAVFFAWFVGAELMLRAKARRQTQTHTCSHARVASGAGNDDDLELAHAAPGAGPGATLRALTAAPLHLQARTPAKSPSSSSLSLGGAHVSISFATQQAVLGVALLLGASLVLGGARLAGSSAESAAMCSGWYVAVAAAAALGELSFGMDCVACGCFEVAWMLIYLGLSLADNVSDGDVVGVRVSTAMEQWPRGALTALCIAVTAPAAAAALALRIARHSRTTFLTTRMLRAQRQWLDHSARGEAQRCQVWLAMLNDAHDNPVTVLADGSADRASGCDTRRLRSSVVLHTLVHNVVQMAGPLFRRCGADLRIGASEPMRTAEINPNELSFDAGVSRSEPGLAHRDSAGDTAKGVCVHTDVGRVTHALMDLLACAAQRAERGGVVELDVQCIPMDAWYARVVFEVSTHVARGSGDIDAGRDPQSLPEWQASSVLAGTLPDGSVRYLRRATGRTCVYSFSFIAQLHDDEEQQRLLRRHQKQDEEERRRERDGRWVWDSRWDPIRSSPAKGGAVPRHSAMHPLSLSPQRLAQITTLNAHIFQGNQQQPDDPSCDNEFAQDSHHVDASHAAGGHQVDHAHDPEDTHTVLHVGRGECLPMLETPNVTVTTDTARAHVATEVSRAPESLPAAQLSPADVPDVNSWLKWYGRPSSDARKRFAGALDAASRQAQGVRRHGQHHAGDNPDIAERGKRIAQHGTLQQLRQELLAAGMQAFVIEASDREDFNEQLSSFMSASSRDRDQAARGAAPAGAGSDDDRAAAEASGLPESAAAQLLAELRVDARQSRDEGSGGRDPPPPRMNELAAAGAELKAAPRPERQQAPDRAASPSPRSLPSGRQQAPDRAASPSPRSPPSGRQQEPDRAASPSPRSPSSGRQQEPDRAASPSPRSPSSGRQQEPDRAASPSPRSPPWSQLQTRSQEPQRPHQSQPQAQAQGAISSGAINDYVSASAPPTPAQVNFDLDLGPITPDAEDGASSVAADTTVAEVISAADIALAQLEEYREEQNARRKRLRQQQRKARKARARARAKRD